MRRTALALALLTAAPAFAQTPADSAMTAPVVAPTVAAADSVPPPPTVDTARARALYDEGVALLEAGDANAALAKFDAGLVVDSMSAANVYGRATALDRLNRLDEAYVAYDRAAALALAANDMAAVETVRRAAAAAASRQVTDLLAADPLAADVAARAVPLLERVEGQAGASPDLHLQFARAFNAMGRHLDAATRAEQAIAAVAGTPGDHSALYYQLGMARVGLSDAGAARAAFEQALNGVWASWAQHQLTQLGASGG